MPKRNVVAMVFSITSLIGACANVEPVHEQAKVAADASLPKTPQTWAAVQARLGDVKVGWIDAFDDTVLTALVIEAQKNNRNLQTVAATVDRSRALAKTAGAALTPNVTLSSEAQRSGSVDSGGNRQTTQNIALQASWEVDVWGRIRSGEQAARQSLEATEADYRFAQHSLAAGVARAYFVAIEAQQQVDVAKSVVKALVETERIVNVQYANGATTAQDVSLTRSDLAAAKESLAAAQGGERDAVRAVELLLGRYPGADLKVRTSLPALPKPPPAGLTSDILERRPDLVAAERRIAAAMGSTQQAKAARLPQVSLTSSIGGSSTQLSDLLKPANLIWTVATNLLVPLVDGGAREAEVEAATADQKQAVAAYAEVALTAFGEVETALDQRVVFEQRRVALAEAHKAAQEALRLAQLRFKEGESDLLDVLSIQQRVFDAHRNLLSVERSQLQQYVDLNLALGGDWRSVQ